MTTFDNEFTNPNRAQARKDEEDPWVMYLIVRESLRMGIGKTAAQVGHAVGILSKVYLRLFTRDQSLLGEEHLMKISNFENWESAASRKIVLKADDKEWEKIKEEYKQTNSVLGPYIVRDAGLTEIAAGSETVIGLWPIKKSQAPKIVRKLQVL